MTGWIVAAVLGAILLVVIGVPWYVFVILLLVGVIGYVVSVLYDACRWP